MSLGLALVIGLLLGALYALTRRVLTASHPRVAGRTMLLKWPEGIGRSSVVEVKAGIIRLSPPVMREEYIPPAPGTELLLKPLGGGPVQRAKFVAHGDSGWTVRLR